MENLMSFYITKAVEIKARSLFAEISPLYLNADLISCKLGSKFQFLVSFFI